MTVTSGVTVTQARPLRLAFRVGARTLAAIPRRLVFVPYSLDDALATTRVPLPPLPEDADGYLVTSLPETAFAALRDSSLSAFVRQRYVRYHIDLRMGVDAWLAGLSASARSGLKRKARKLAAANGGQLDVRAYHSAAEFVAFHPMARAISATTYQEKLLDAGLPDDPASTEHLSALAAADRLRAWLMFVDDVPVAYLCCAADGESLRYDHVGHDPAFNDLSPGAVLQVEAMRALFAEARFARFDFTEGEGQHKRQFSTGGVACVDVLLLRPTIANRTAMMALTMFDGAVALAKRATTNPALKRIVNRIRR